MRAIISILALILLLFVWTGCASIPLTESEKAEYKKVIGNCSDSMDFYTRLQRNAGRAPISVKVVRAQSSDTLKNELVKSRRTFSRCERFKRGLLNREILRDELDIRTKVY